MSEEILGRGMQLLRQRLLDSGLTAADVTPSPPRGESARNPLSAGQRRMWFLQTREPEDTTLNICVAFRLVGALDEPELRRAVETVVGRHEILRTTYHVDDEGEPYQVPHDSVEIAWQEHDLTDLPERSRSRRVEVLARRAFGRSFDLSSDVPLRVSSVRAGADETVLIMVVHHICWDDESWGVFFSEVNAAYNGTGDPASLRKQYVDVEVLDPGGRTRVEEAEARYWRDTLIPMPEPLELPGQPAYAGAASKRSSRCTQRLSAELVDDVNAIARRHGATSFMVLLAAFDATIHRYTSATDFVVAVPVTNRRDAAAEALVGYFGNTLLVRSTFDPTDTFEALIDSTRDAAAGAFAHQSVGIDRVVRDVNPDRAGGKDGLAQLTQLSFGARSAADVFALQGVESTMLDLGSAVAQVPLGFMVILGESGALVEAEYFVDTLERRLVEQLLAGYVEFLTNAVAAPSRRISAVDVLGHAGRAGIAAVSRGPLTDTTPGTLTEMVENQMAASGDRPALASDEIALTYDGLNRRANRLAHWLIERKVGPENLIALELSTSVEFVVAALAVLKAGAAYLPIDPAYPLDRIDYLIEDASPELVLGDLALSSAEVAAATLAETNPTDSERVSPLRPTNLAYVMYTSGSTGMSKGVPVPHAAIAEHLSGFNAEFGMTSQDRLLQTSSVSFDASLFEIFSTLTLGAQLVVPKPNGFRDIAYIADVVARHEVTVLHMVPSMLSTFLLLPAVNEWRMLRLVPVGGEALAGEVADKFANVFDAELSNNYGPTEAVVAATHFPVDGPQGTRIVPIGTPNPNVYIHVLDEALHLVPIGVMGEIYIGGNQLARGYLNRPALTAERFVADPFRAGGRLYRTGDLARRNSADDIEFVGRADEQVKIRGFRIELREIEAVIAGHPSVAHCVVIAIDDETLGAVLAAYVVPEAVVPGVVASIAVDFDQIRAYAGTVLPAHMVPAAFAQIDEVPLTVHGKLDRQALPTPVPGVAPQYREPRTPTEIRVGALYSRIFGRDRVGADDSFFDLGGHSLLAARLITQIRAEFGLDIDVSVPFDSPTVSGLAARLVEQFRDVYGIDLDDGRHEVGVQAETARCGRPDW